MITELGIGNGVSILIIVSIIAKLPDVLFSLTRMLFAGMGAGGSDITLKHLLILMALFFVVTAGAIALRQVYHKISVCCVPRRDKSRGDC